ncbi:MAG: xylan 1,4-beta-xylosidase, partial [Clostridiales bacterium]|nr:xylan 1,4-beta-xylosidase [Candidatus Blautia equi]
QLTMVQDICHFKHIRGHGLFCEDMSIYQPYKDAEGAEHEAYCFTYLDRVMDDYKARGIKPFLELGFMPGKMASGTQTIFYWKGNTTPPEDEGKWTRLVKATLSHLVERYGREEVGTWPVEVWNEPNLPGFWENADKEKYLRLYEITVLAVKEVLPEFRVGGPAVCGGPTSFDWIRDFLTFCRDKKLPVDFLTRHAYMGNDPHNVGRYLYHEMRTVQDVYDEMNTTREIIDSFPEYKGMEMHITEFNTSYNPFCPIHDTNLNAAYVAGLLARLGDVAASYSYWTFGDVFEEQGVPSRPFHGGFGMVANQMIPKPTLWTFDFFNNLKGTPVYRDENAVILRREDGSYEGVLWNLCRESREELELSVSLPGEGRCTLLTRTVDEKCCNPLKIWHEMGEPASLTAGQLAFLQESGRPANASASLNACDGTVTVNQTLTENAVVHFTLAPTKVETDYGYDYQWYCYDHA